MEAHLPQKASSIWWLIVVRIKDLSFSAHYKITVRGHFNSTAPFKDCWIHWAFILSCTWIPSSPSPIQQSSIPFQRCWLLSTKYLLESSSQRIQASQRIHQKYGAQQIYYLDPRVTRSNSIGDVLVCLIHCNKRP